MAYYCSDCAYRAPGILKNGKFPCTNRNSGYKEVPATQNASYCRVFCNALGSTYSTREKEEAYRASKSHGWFIVTAISDILGLGLDNDYMNTFGYIREVFIPEFGYQADFIEDYETVGKEVAESLYKDENREDYAEYLVENYLNSFVSLVKSNENERAVDLYIDMYSEVKKHYGYEEEKSNDIVKKMK